MSIPSSPPIVECYLNQVPGVSEFLTINTIKNLPSLLREGDFVAVRLESLVTPKQEFPSVRWRERRIVENKERSQMSFKEAEEEAWHLWGAGQIGTKVETMERDTANSIARVQKAGFLMIGFTDRSLELVKTTQNQNTSVGIDFHPSSPEKDEVHSSKRPGVLLEKGVLYTSRLPVKEALKGHFKGQRLVFLDQDKDCIAAMKEVCRASNIPFLALFYQPPEKHCLQTVGDLQMERYCHISSPKHVNEAPPKVVETPSSSQIRVLEKIEDLLLHLKEGDAVSFDYDFTVGRPVTEFPGDHWYNREKNVSGYGFTMPRLFAGHHFVEHIEVEAGKTAATVRKAQEIVSHLFFTTSRSLELVSATPKHLSRLGIDPKAKSPTQKELYFPGKQASLFRDGIHHISGQHKGNKTKDLEHRVGACWKRLVVIDDSMVALQQYVETYGDRCLPFHYPFAEVTKPLKWEVAHNQANNFGHFLTDEEARSLLEIQAE